MEPPPLKLEPSTLELEPTPLYIRILAMDPAPLKQDAGAGRHTPGAGLLAPGAGRRALGAGWRALGAGHRAPGAGRRIFRAKQVFGLCSTSESISYKVLSPLPPEKLCYGRHGCVEIEIHWQKKTDKCFIQINPRKPFPYD